MVGVISGDGEKDSGSAKVCIQHSSGHGDGLAFNAGKSIDKEVEFPAEVGVGRWEQARFQDV